MQLTPGARLGNYEVVDLLGVGGMGEVYRAKDLRLGREVAVKILPASVASAPDRLARFEREARTVAGLSHPNIVVLHSIEDEGDLRFLTMELVEGTNLDHELAAGGLPAERITAVGIALADALAAAHDKGVVHRDLKPANVMVTREGRIKILDFGLAKLDDSVVDSLPAEDTMLAQDTMPAGPLSAAGQVMGTVPYMAPEQVRGEAVDGRTDIFALGIILYELATGRRPFQGSTLGVISTAILRDPPPPLESVRSDLPLDLQNIIGRCLEKQPQARFQNAKELVEALQHMRQAREGGSFIKPPPTPSTPLIGREQDLETAMERVSSGARILTITGYGGTGKTRFSVELFRRLAPEYAGGAAFVSLAAVTAAEDVLPTVAVALEIAEAHGRTALDALRTVIADRPALLVLDNLEQVLDAASEIGELSALCPGLQVIATSRAPLKIGAEVEFALPPLALPQGNGASLKALAESPAVQLFVQRAQKVKADFKLSENNAGPVADICRKLDGLPLALELAAARARILEPAALLRRLDHALDLLTSGDRDLPVRQRTLRATISWSYSLLTADEQRVLRSLSVFHNGWTLEAMEHICFSEEDRFRALDELDSLVEKGLVRVVGSGERYDLLETIRAFSSEQLHAEGRMDALRHAHAAYFQEFADQVARDFRGTGQRAAVLRAWAENANLLAGIQWLMTCADEGDASALENALLFCGALNWFWHVGGQHLRARVLLDHLLPLVAEAEPSRGRALASMTAGMISTVTGELERSLSEWGRGYEDGQALGDGQVSGEGKMGVGYCNLNLGRMEEAREALDASIALSGDCGDDYIRALSMTLKGLLLFLSQDLEAGIALVEEALKIQERMKDGEGGGIAYSFLAQMTSAQGKHARALDLYRESLAQFEIVGDRPEMARVHSEMGWAALSGKDFHAARESFRRAVHAHEEVGSPRGTGLAILGLAAVDAADGRTERAVSFAAAARALSERAGVVVDHPMDPGLVERIEAMKASIPKAALEDLVSQAETLTPADVLAQL